VTVGARTSVPAELVQISVIEGGPTSRDGIARLHVATELYSAVSFQNLPEACVWHDGSSQADEGK